jgi:hypothetical protein
MALEKIETFCQDFTKEHLAVFVPILEKLELASKIQKDLKEKLNSGYRLILVFIEESKHRFPHGGKPEGPLQTIQEVLIYLVDLLSAITRMIQAIYIWVKKKRKRSYTLTRGYDKKWTTLLKEYDSAFERWEILLEPVFVMIASPIQHDRSRRVAQSRVVNTLNRFNKLIELPQAHRYTGYNQWTHRNQLPYGNAPKPSLSPPRTRKKTTIQKRVSVKGTAKGTRF